MILTTALARETMFETIWTVWSRYADLYLGAGTKDNLRFQGVELTEKIPQNEGWGYAEQIVTSTRPAGLRGDDNRRYTSVGVLTIDVYCSRARANAIGNAIAMGDKIRRQLEKSRGTGVWYRRVTATPAGQDAGFEVVRVMADFEYTEQGVTDG